VKIQYSNVLQESVLDGLITWASNQLYYIVLCGNFTTKLPRRANSLYVSQMCLCFWWNGMLNCVHSLTFRTVCVRSLGCWKIRYFGRTWQILAFKYDCCLL